MSTPKSLYSFGIVSSKDNTVEVSYSNSLWSQKKSLSAIGENKATHTMKDGEKG